MLDAFEQLLDGQRLRVIAESRQQILLQRLACGGGATSKDSMDFLGNVFDLNTRHSLNVPPIWRHGN